MLIRIGKKRLIYSSLNLSFVLMFLIVCLLIVYISPRLEIRYPYFEYRNKFDIKNDSSVEYSPSMKCLLKMLISFNKWKLIHLNNKTYETKIECVGPLYNQSCLYQNLYFVDQRFLILTIKGRDLPNYSVQTNAFIYQTFEPIKRIFENSSDLERFVDHEINPKVFPSVTLYFGQFWHNNIGHALFDGLYPGYLSLIRFSPRHLNPFRILANIEECQNCWSEDIYNRFSGLGLIKRSLLNKISDGQWFMFDELIMGSGRMCQRCTQPNFQLPGGIELDGSRLFRDRMYHQHYLIPPQKRIHYSSEYRKSNDLLIGYIIDNKRFTNKDLQEINNAINQINSYTNNQLSKRNNSKIDLQFPLIRIYYLHYNQVKSLKHFSSFKPNLTSNNCQSSKDQIREKDFLAQLKLLRQMDIHISGPGTGQMYQTFLPDGSVHINLGGLRISQSNNKEYIYTSYLEQYMASGTPHIKALYYPINQRTNGIEKEQLIILIRQAANIISQGFALPVNPRENLAPDGQLFLEMCQRDKEFCSLVTERTSYTNFACLDFWVEDFVHEQRQWKLGGFIQNGRNLTCPFNRTLLHQLRYKYHIQPYSDQTFRHLLTKFISLFQII